MALRCPVCRVDLHDIANRTGVAAACSSCFGIWLDNVCSRSVVTNLLEPAVKYVAQVADAKAAEKQAAPASGAGAYRTPASRPPANEPRTCAQCGAAMAPSHVASANVTLDVCAAHGTWFDAGELHTLSQQIEIASLADDADAAAFGREMDAYRRADAARDLRAAGVLVGFLRR